MGFCLALENVSRAKKVKLAARNEAEPCLASCSLSLIMYKESILKKRVAERARWQAVNVPSNHLSATLVFILAPTTTQYGLWINQVAVAMILRVQPSTHSPHFTLHIA
jgi:hypothetical protein